MRSVGLVTTRFTKTMDSSPEEIENPNLDSSAELITHLRGFKCDLDAFAV